MRDLGLDALVKASRAVNTPGSEARERNRHRLALRVAAGVIAGAAASGAREAAAAIPGGAAPGTGAGASAALAGGVARWAVVKWAVVSILIVIGGATGLGVYVARGRASTSPPPAAAFQGPPSAPEPDLPSASDAPAVALPAASPDPPASATTAPAGAPRARQESPAAPEGSASQSRNLERELQLLRSARRALDTGSPATALALLARYAGEFPHGVLQQECQATRILALCAAGRTAPAQQARDQFLKQHPGSPLADRVRATCGVAR